MKKLTVSSTLGLLMAIFFVCSGQFLISCKNDTPDPNPTTGTTNPGSGTVTTPGTGTTTTPGTGTTTTPGTGTTSTGSVVSVSETIGQTANLTLLAAAVAKAGLGSELNKGELTLFAPTDDAFKAAGYATTTAINALQASDLQRILRYHVIGSRIDLGAFPTNVNTSYQTTLADSRVVVFKSGETVTVNNAKIIQGNIATTGSVIHIIDRLLIPPTITVVDLVKSNADLSLLAAAIDRAGSTIQTLATTNTATGISVFAPTNAAFKAAGYADEAAIKAADPKVLANLLSYHILNYRAYLQTFQNGSDIVTAQGESLRFTVSNNKVTILGKGNGTNVATITQGDFSTTGGVVHIVDRVLLP
ncbi:fasciclin domain-containing protein [Spirosoma foliorum]|uniref:Fasciclin domain-containing protein n=1 Tax=Spirosoma foliorum TaxID=2710596 RepID=A0A7G5H1Z7_9BACT|nr:fasciclin domain-containing protein [Spirosoma foliorum]QMW05139.1 fasciclin domain-containing protein [Spirosoma foliorum]